MMNTMTCKLSKGNKGGRSETRRRDQFGDPGVASASSGRRPVRMIFRLGEEPEGATIVRYHDVLNANAFGGGTVCADVVFDQPVTCLPNLDLSVSGRGGRFDCFDDELPNQQSMSGSRSEYERRSRPFKTGPVKRFLTSRIGQDWGMVRSELLRGDKNGHRHQVEGVLENMVATNVTVGDDDQLFHPESGKPLSETWDRFMFYVHPVTGRLDRIARLSKAAKRVQPDRPEQVDMGDLQKLVRIDDIWYVVDFAPIPMVDTLPLRTVGDYSYREAPKDIVVGCEAVNDPSRDYTHWPSKRKANYAVDQLVQAWGAPVYAVSKRQAGRKELTRYGVRRAA